MSFGRELKDFASGFKTGYEMIPDMTDDQKSAREMKKGMNSANSDPAAGPNAKAEGFDGATRSGSPGRKWSDGPLPGEDKDTEIAEMSPVLKMAIRDSGEHGFNALTYGGKEKTADLTNMTLDEVDKFQQEMPSKGHKSTAVGGFQMIRPTLRAAREALGLSGDTKFTPEVQVKLAAQLVKNRGYEDYKAGKIDANKFAKNLSQEWAILPKDASGAGYYDGFNGNKAAVGWDEVMGALKPKTQTATRPARTAALDINGEEEEQGVMAAEGGLIELPPEPQTESGPTPTAVTMDPTAGASPAAEGPRRTIKQSELVTHDDTVSEALDSGMKYISRAFGFDKPQAVMGASPESDERLQAFANNAGAAEPEELHEVYNTVDPQQRMTDDQRQVAGFKAVYKYWMEKGDPVRAARASAGMMMASKKVVGMSGTMALAAYENGDIQGMVDSVIQGKNQIPDGESVRATKITPKGVEFEVIDNSGKVKSKGKATIDQMVELAGQMQTGAAWFDEMTNASRGKTGKERETEKRQSALDIWNKEEAASDKGFMASLSPERQEAFNKLHPTEQNRVRQAWAQEQRQKAADERWNINRADKLSENLTDNEWREFRELVRKDEWTKTREERMSAAERQEAQRQQDLDDRNTRQQLSFEERRKRNAEIDEKILQRRGEKASAGGAGKTLTERREQAVDVELGQRKSAIAADIPEGEYGPTQKQAVEMGQAEAGAGYKRATAGNKPDRGRIDEDAEAFGTRFDADFKDKPLTPVVRSQFIGAANSIREANPTVTVDDAALIVKTAVDPKASPRVLQDGRVQVHPQLKPVFMDEHALRQLEAIRNRTVGVTRTGNAQGTGLVGTAQAAPAGQAAPTQAVAVTDAYVKQSPAAQRRAEAVAARRGVQTDFDRQNALRMEAEHVTDKNNERQALIKKLGSDYDLMLKQSPSGVVTLKALRQAVDDKQREERPSDPARARRATKAWAQ